MYSSLYSPILPLELKDFDLDSKVYKRMTYDQVLLYTNKYLENDEEVILLISQNILLRHKQKVKVRFADPIRTEESHQLN